MALTDSLVSYWKVDESSGNLADAVASNTLTNVGTSTFGAGKINNAATVNGSTQYFTLGANISTATTNISFGGWFKTSSIGATQTLIGEGHGGGSGAGYALQINTAGKARVDISFVAAITGTTTLSTGTWYHIFGTRGASTWNIYLNGTSEGTGTNNPFGIGAGERFSLGAFFNDSSSYSNFLTGSLDEVGFWTRELSGSEVSQLYNGGSGLAYPFTTSSIKTIDGLASASVKTVNGVAIALVKNINGLT